MSSIPPILARTTMLMSGDQLHNRLRETQRQLHDAQRQISTGLRYGAPSDAPDKTSSILFLSQRLNQREQHDQNLQHAESMLNNIDSALSEATTILNDTKSIALSQIGVGSDQETRETTALTIDAKIKGLMDQANNQFNNVSLFGGSAGGGETGQVFESFLGGVRYNGSETNLKVDAGLNDNPVFTATGAEAFGALSARIVSEVDLDPQASSDTRIADVKGAQNEGVRLGTLKVTVDGTDTNVDLSNADTLGDVVTRINNAIDGIDNTAGSLALSGTGYALTANAGHTITVADIGSGQTAADLGIDLSANGATANGADVNRKLTELTELSDLGTGVDFASGLTITQGDQTKTADFSSANNIQDLQNVIDQLNFGLRLNINDNGDGLNLVSEVSGVELSVGENGGSTANDLGLRNFGLNTRLSDFRHGLGVENIQGEDDFTIQTHDGTSFSVNIDGDQTVGDVINTINSAATAAGLTVGAGNDLVVGLAGSGNGFRFIDNTAGGSDFKVQNTGQSLAATHLGIHQNIGGSNTLSGDDKATVKVDGVFTHMIELRDALANNDELGITLAGDRLEDDLNNVAKAQAQVGVDAQRVQQQRTRADEQRIAEKNMLSQIQDAELTEVITRFTQLQTQLQASLRAGAQNMQLSLLDFLR